MVYLHKVQIICNGCFMSDVDTMLFYTVKELDSHAKHGQSLKKNYEHFSQKSAHTQQPEREQEHAHQCGSFGYRSRWQRCTGLA